MSPNHSHLEKTPEYNFTMPYLYLTDQIPVDGFLNISRNISWISWKDHETVPKNT